MSGSGSILELFASKLTYDIVLVIYFYVGSPFYFLCFSPLPQSTACVKAPCFVLRWNLPQLSTLNCAST